MRMEGRAATTAAKTLLKKWISVLINLHHDCPNSLTLVKVREPLLELKLRRTLFKLRNRKKMSPSLANESYKNANLSILASWSCSEGK